METNYKLVKKIILPKIFDKRGNLSVIEQFKNIPFAIKNIYWIYDVTSSEEIPKIMLTRNELFIVALSGSFDVITENENNIITYHLNRPYFGIYIPDRIPRHLDNFSTNSVCLILSSSEEQLYDLN